MSIKKIKIIPLFLILLVVLSNCTSTGKFKKAKPFKHNTPLIKENIKEAGQSEIAKTLEMGPKPVFGDTTNLNKRKKISSQSSRNYLIIPDSYTNLKQRFTKISKFRL